MGIVEPDSCLSDVEYSICIIKEHLQFCVHGLPYYKCFPKIVVHHVVAEAVFV